MMELMHVEMRLTGRSVAGWCGTWRSMLQRRSVPLLLLVGLSSVGSVLTGCSGDTSGAAAVLAPSSLYWDLKLNYRAVNLALVAPYDTVRLTATALDATGHAIPNAGPITYSIQTTDSTVTVDSAGLVQAYYKTPSVSNPTYVIAVLTIGNVTHRDTAFIQVLPAVPAPSPLDTFMIRPMVGDSARMSWDYLDVVVADKQISVYATDRAGNVLRDDNVNHLLVSFSSGDELIAIINKKTGTISTGPGSTSMVGHVMLYVSTYAYGVAARDSLPFLVGYPIGAFSNPICWIGDTTSTGAWRVNSFAPASIRVGVGATVRINDFCTPDNFPMPATDTLDIVFDDTTAIVDEDLIHIPAGTLLFPGSSHRFVLPRAGVFNYHSARYGGSGTIIVGDPP